MILHDLIHIFEQLRDEQTASINKAIQKCIELHSRDGNVDRVEEANTISLDSSNQGGTDVNAQAENTSDFERNRFSVVDDDGVYLNLCTQSSKGRTDDVDASMSSRGSSQSCDLVSIPSEIEPIVNTQDDTASSLVIQVDPIEQQSVGQGNPLEENSNKKAESDKTEDSNGYSEADSEKSNNKKRLVKKSKERVRLSRMFVCDAKNCQSAFTTRISLDEHKSTHKSTHTDRELYECKVCKKAFGYKSSLVTHLRIHTGEKPYICSECDKSFRYSSNLSTHMSIHNGEKPYICSVCEKSFRRSEHLSRHMLIHNGEKPFICSVCEKSFRRSEHLSSHMRIHNGAKPYICSVCSKSFRQSGDLSKHMRIHNGEKPYICTKCNKSFRHSCSLSTHMRIHNGLKPFICSVCEKSFRRSDHLSTHMRIHNGEKPYICSICNKSFRQSCNLSRHMRIHNGEKSHTCGVCNKPFRYLCNLTAHSKTYHDNNQPNNTKQEVFSCEYCGKYFFNKNDIESHCLQCYKTKNVKTFTR